MIALQWTGWRVIDDDKRRRKEHSRMKTLIACSDVMQEERRFQSQMVG